jgi:hypothetical protein
VKSRAQSAAVAWTILLAVLAPAVARSAPAAATADPFVTRLKTRVAFLCSPQLAGRGNGTAAAEICADTLGGWFAAAGLAPVAGVRYQTFPLRGEEYAGRTMRNVLGAVPGAGRLAGRWLVVGAHYDHLGRSDTAPPPPAEPAAEDYYPGANDNASGVAVLMELAAAATDGMTLDPDASRRSLLFIAFGAEEIGLQGSTYWVEHPSVPLDSVDVMLNFDSIGRLADGGLYVGGVGSAPRLRDQVVRAAGDRFELHLSDAGWAGSDHVSFLAHGVPALFFFTGAYPEYNRPEDRPGTLDYAGLERIARLATRLIDALRSDPGTFPYQSVAPGAGATAAATAGGNRSTWFGSLPDFASEKPGYRIAGVFPGSPAARAGIAPGDRIVRFAGVEVRDLADFTRALRSCDPGEPVELELIRDGRRLRFTVVLGDRADREH